MTYHAMGAGPGPTTTYKIDAPFPWGNNTELTLPLDQMMTDAWTALKPEIDKFESQLINDAETELNLYGPKLAKDIMDNTVMPAVQNELEVSFAELDMMKTEVEKTLVIVGLTLVAAVGFGAYFLKKG